MQLSCAAGEKALRKAAAAQWAPPMHRAFDLQTPVPYAAACQRQPLSAANLPIAAAVPLQTIGGGSQPLGVLATRAVRDMAREGRAPADMRAR